MAELSTSIRPSMAAAGLLAALALGGCAATNVTDSWQCPLAQGKACTSVSAADPAVPETADPRGLATQLPFYRTRPAPPPSRCTEGCNPFGWIADLFTAKSDDSGAVADGPADASKAAAVGRAEAQAATVAPSETDTGATEHSVVAAGIPSTPGPATPVPADDDLRTDEVIGRIWIAPFVDENGVYHEASWVRAVFEAAGWRLK